MLLKSLVHQSGVNQPHCKVLTLPSTPFPLLVLFLLVSMLSVLPFSSLPLQEVVTKIEETQTGANDRPVKDVTIVDCGRLDKEPFHSEKDY